MDSLSEKIIMDVKAKIDIYDSIDRNDNDLMNIISILGVDTDEVAMCKILCALLSYEINGEKIYLYSFIRSVLDIEFDDSEVSSLYVRREYCIPYNNRRIDIVIASNHHFIPIEAKINAEDQDKQCFDYLKFASRFYSDENDSYLYYLTKKGNKPSNKSICGDEKLLKRIKLISWTDILNWLKSVIDSSDASFGMLDQYSKALELFENNERKKMVDMDIENMLNNPQNLEAAILIERALSRKKTNLLHSIFDSILKELGNNNIFHFDPDINEPWDFNRAIDIYYSYKKSSYPALNFNLGEIGCDDDGAKYYFVLRYEIDWNSLIGYGIIKRKKDVLSIVEKPSNQLIESVKRRMVDSSWIKKKKDNSWFLYWEYVVSNSDEVCDDEPNFKEMNKSYLQLFSENGKNDYIKMTIHSLKKFIDNVKV